MTKPPIVVDISRNIPDHIRVLAKKFADAERAYQIAIENANTIARYEDTSRISDLYAETVKANQEFSDAMYQWMETFVESHAKDNDTGQDGSNSVS
jgi:hypothetical protein